MNADFPPVMKGMHFFRRAFPFFREQTGQSLGVWMVVAGLNFLAQIVFRRELAPGEFGTFNTVLGVVGLMAVPLVALDQAFTRYVARDHVAGRMESLREAAPVVTETFAWVWAVISFVLLLALLPLLVLPRFSLHLFALLNVLIALGGVVSGAVCASDNKTRFWGWLLAASALTRVLLGAGLAGMEPWAEAGLAAFLLAGFITLTPVLRDREIKPDLLKALPALADREFLLYLAATFSVVLALFLFSSADRIVAQSWFGSASNNNIDYVDWKLFDAYQTAGLLGRALFWGTQPLLLILFVQRSRLNRTTAASLLFFWIYLGVLVPGVILFCFLASPLSWLFCGADYQLTAVFVPSFAFAMLPLGLLQGLGMFSLASRRYPECFVLGGCGVGYLVLLYLVGRQPQLMPVYMFGAGVVSAMAVLFVGVVRWGRRQP